jgi:hypothetical protein
MATMKIYFTIALINPEGYRAARLGSPFTLEYRTTTGQAARDLGQPLQQQSTKVRSALK